MIPCIAIVLSNCLLCSIIILLDSLGCGRVILPDRCLGCIIICLHLSERFRQLIGHILNLLTPFTALSPEGGICNGCSGRNLSLCHIAVTCLRIKNHRQHFVFLSLYPLATRQRDDPFSYIFRHEKSPLLNSSLSVLSDKMNSRRRHGARAYSTRELYPPPLVR